MEMPEYDNRPKPGTPLYQDNTNDWKEFLFPALIIGLPILASFLFEPAMIKLFRAIKSLLS